MPPKKPAATGADGAAPPKPAENPAAKVKTKEKLRAARPVPAAPVEPVPAAPVEPVPTAPPAADAASVTPPRRVGGGLIAAGVGSAALVAALLFATRGKRNDWSK